ncbi:hypothetical protein R3P38DRAFT_276267 [Favolaschia claudopus]|uniref:Uncharacterized protein n=1 Tax=Favolaschia claudopus TaxID=2862362 RepID=A0AAV9ZRA2_9AGAR
MHILAHPEICATPKLPIDLERVVFELAAHNARGEIPRYMRVAWRVKQWLEPVLYQFLFVAVYNPNTLPDGPVGELRRIRIEAMLSLISTKPPSFLRSIKRLILNVAIEQHAKIFDLLVLSACSHVTDLYLMSGRRQLSPAYLPRLCELRHLRRLTVAAGLLFYPNPVDYGSPLFRNITHLELLQNYKPIIFRIGQDLAQAPSLTHIAFASTADVPVLHAAVRVIERLKCILFRADGSTRLAAIQPLSPDDRLVCMAYHYSLVLPWYYGAVNGEDDWAVADKFIAAKRDGKIDASHYLISDKDRIWMRHAPMNLGNI